MTIIGTHEESKTPFLKDYLSTHPKEAQGIFNVSAIIESGKGLLITTTEDKFVCFSFKGSSLYRTLSKVLKSRQGVEHGYDYPYQIVPMGLYDGSFNIQTEDNYLCLVDTYESKAGNTIYKFVHRQTRKQVESRGYPIHKSAKR